MTSPATHSSQQMNLRNGARRRFAALGAAAAASLLLLAGLPGSAAAEPDPPGCTNTISYDSSIPTFAQVAATASPAFTTLNGQSTNALGGFQTGTNNRHPSADLYA